MIFRTEITPLQQIENQIDYKSNLFLLGSCFSNHIGDKLNYFQFNTTQNPLGILFHPYSIEKLLSDAKNKKKYSSSDLVFNNEQWHCWHAHSSISSANKSKLLHNLNNAILATHKQLLQSTHIIITLGTSWLYRFIEKDILVANCHKIPQNNFVKELFSVAQITEVLLSIICLLKEVNKKATIIFTVSPVRHLKDGFVENMQSKSHLISAIHSVLNSKEKVSYFASYEMMLDDLRDYRFYAEDMIHPNQIAINYIWGKFVNTWLSESTAPIMKEIDSIKKGLLHKPFNINSLAHQKFLENLANKKKKLLSNFPYIDF